MNLNELRDKAYRNAVAHGWHEQEYSDEHFLCLVISELMEAVEADRYGKRAQIGMFKEWQGNSIPLTEETRQRRFKEDFEAFIKGTVEEELADACIRLLDLAGKNSIDLTFAESLLTEHSSIIIAGSLTEAMYVLCGLLSKTTKGYGIDIFWHIEQKMKYNLITKIV